MAKTTRTIVTVTNNNDSGEGSLRSAIEQTQAKNGGKFEIIFQSNESPNNELTTGYFTIELESPLPAIYRNDVRINETSPRSIILVPKEAAKSVQPFTGSMNTSGPGRVNGSMLYVGDPNYIYYLYKNSVQIFGIPLSFIDIAPYSLNQRPKVSINNISFIRNQAKGGKGERGSGGGLGSGGAITLINGDLAISNSVFQDLEAKGGGGGEGTLGGFGFSHTIAVKTRDGTSGETGGRGGASSVPYRKDNVRDQLFFSEGSVGGSGGNPGEGTKLCGGGAGGATKHAGKNGGDGADFFAFGFGGAGAGAGGGGAYHWNGFPACGFVGHIITHYDGGIGGRGGAAGWGGGQSGGTGGRGENSFHINVIGQKTEVKDRTRGESGRRGDSVGNAISILNHVARQSLGNETSDTLGLEANLELDNVSFYKNKRDGQVIFSDQNSNNIYINNVRDGSGRNDHTAVEVGDTDSSFSHARRDLASRKFPSKISLPAFWGLSQPRVPQVADYSNTTLRGTRFSDRFYVAYEDRSTITGITTDVSDPENPINRLWVEIVPDQEDQILAEYQAKANVSYADAVTPDWEDLAWNVAEESISAGIEHSLGGVPVVGDVTAHLAVGFAKDHMAYMSEQVTLERDRDVALEENRKQQQQLMQNLNDQSNSKIASVDLSLERSRVIIQDFSLGRDNITFPLGPNNEEVIIASIGTNPQDTVRVNLAFDGGSNADLPFLSVDLDNPSVQALRNADNTSEDSYIQSLLTRVDDQHWVLGSRLKNATTVTTTNYSSGPAGTTMTVERGELKLDLKDNIVINGGRGMDIVYGSDGTERINTGSSDDMIFPGYGGDFINGGTGSDLVSYVSRLTAEESPEELSLTAINEEKVVVNSIKGNKRVGELRNIENYHLFGESIVNFSNLATDQEDQSQRSRSIITGSGSNITGSNADETFKISFFEDYNRDVDTAYGLTTSVNGGEGNDSLFIYADNSPVEFTIEEDDNIIQVYRADNDQLLVEAKGIEFFHLDGTLKARTQDPTAQQFGTQSVDTIEGSFKNETLKGLRGNDRIFAGSGDDILSAGRGQDILDGGQGDDIYRLRIRDQNANMVVLDSGNDTIINFNPLRDVLGMKNIESVILSDKRKSEKSDTALEANVLIDQKKERILYRNDDSTTYETAYFRGVDMGMLSERNFIASPTDIF